MTNQDFFTKAVTHTLSQTERSRDKGGNCVYAGENGNACAVGCVLPREVAELADLILNDMGDSSVYALIKEVPEAAEILAGVDTRLMNECQHIHDESGRWPDQIEFMRRRFSLVAEQFGLEMPK